MVLRPDLAGGHRSRGPRCPRAELAALARLADYLRIDTINPRG